MKYLEIGPEKNSHTKRGRFSKEWSTVGCSQKTTIDIQADVDKGLPFKDDAFEIVFSSHVLEHLSNPTFFLCECFRVLIPGGVCRVNVPDARVLIAYYQKGKIRLDDLVEQFRSYRKAMHKRGYDPLSLAEQMTLAGFVEIRTCDYLESNCIEMQHPYFSTRYKRTIRMEGKKWQK